MSETPGLIERLERRNTEKQAMVDGWMKQIADAGHSVSKSQEAAMRSSVDAEAAQAIRELVEGLDNLIKRSKLANDDLWITVQPADMNAGRALITKYQPTIGRVDDE